MAIFHILLANISQKNVLYDIVEQKHAFLSDKNQKLKKKLNFSQGVNPWFWSKNDHFSMFFLNAI